MTTIVRDREYDDDDPIVREYPWAFDGAPAGKKSRRSAGVEQATAAPGEKRRLSRRAKPEPDAAASDDAGDESTSQE
jgi:hypothetical protein